MINLKDSTTSHKTFDKTFRMVKTFNINMLQQSYYRNSFKTPLNAEILSWPINDTHILNQKGMKLK